MPVISTEFRFLAKSVMLRIHLPPTNPEHESVRDFRIFTEKSVYFKWESVESERLILPDPYFDPLYGGFRQSNLTT